MTDATAPRLPDFLLIGARKSGTTSLYSWLGQQPAVWLPANKEPQFFSHDEVWSRGLGWYGALFAGADPGQLVGEASVNYTNPRYHRVAADRIADVVPGVRLLFVARDPVERLRSHYRHAVQRNRERRPLVEAAREPGNRYTAQSCYHHCLVPYIEMFAREQLLVVRFEDLFGPGDPAWPAVLDHLGLERRPAPDGARNVTADKDQFTQPMAALWDWGLLRRAGALPRPVRRLGKRVLTRRGGDYERRLAESTAPLPPDVTGPLWEDAARLREWLGAPQPLWAETATRP